MRMDEEALCTCTHLKGQHSYHQDHCWTHNCHCLKFKWDNLDFLEAKSELKDTEDKRR